MWVHDAKSLQILAVNEAAITQSGYSRDEFLKLILLDLRPDGKRVTRFDKCKSGALNVPFPVGYAGDSANCARICARACECAT